MSVLETLFKALNEAGVRYVVVGGVAVVLQGYIRLTADVDLVVDLEDRQAALAIETLTSMKLSPRVPVDPRDFADRKARESWIRDRGMKVFTMYDPSDPRRVVDLFVSHPIPFEELWSGSEQINVAGTTVRVASIPDLIRMKRQAGRAEDQTDIERLEAIQRQKAKREKP